MRITFILPVVNLSGGIRVISIYAKALADRGHHVTLPSHLDGLNLNHVVLDKFRPVIDKDVPDSDIVIATLWITAEWVQNLSSRKGKKVYFVQHHEIHPHFPIERVKATLRNNFSKIVVSKWLHDVLKSEYQQRDVTIVQNGVDLNVFNSPKRYKPHTCTIGYMYSERSFKGTDIAHSAIESARKIHQDIKIIAFGSVRPTPSILPAGTVFHYKPSQETIVDIYRQCTAWLFTSRTEGFGLPLLEAMACRTPLIATQAGVAPELLASGGGIMVPVDDVQSITQAIINFCEMKHDSWLQFSDEAYLIAQQHGWEDSIDLFESTLQKIANH